MRRAKALLPWRGVTLIEHVVATLTATVDEVVVVASANMELPTLAAQIVRDREPELGPLAGIREGLAAVSAPLAYVTSTDAPFLTPEFVRAVLKPGKSAAPVIDEFVQSMAAVYEKRMLATAETLLADDRRRPLFLLEAADFVRLTAEDLPADRSLDNLNDAQAYLDALTFDADERGVALDPVKVELFGIAKERAGTAILEHASATLGTILETLTAEHPDLPLIADGEPSSAYLYSLDGHRFVRDGDMPVGPGESLLIMDAAVGG